MIAKYYSKIETTHELPGWLARVEEEREELLTRLTALRSYIRTDAFDVTRIGVAQCILLERQCKAMEDYFDILTVRYELGLESLHDEKPEINTNQRKETNQ